MSTSKSIIQHYLAKSVGINFAGVFIILMLIVSGNQFFLVLNEGLKFGLINNEVFYLLFLKIIRDIPIVLIFSFTISIIYSLNKLYKNSELIALNFAGYGDARIYLLLQPVILFFLSIIILFTFFISPEVKQEISSIRSDSENRPDFLILKKGNFQRFKNNDITFFISPEVKQEISSIRSDSENRPDFLILKKGNFQRFKNNDITFFANQEYKDENSEDQIFEDIFIYSNEGKKIILGKKGKKVQEKETKSYFLTLFDGNIYENLEGQLSISKFEKFTLMIYENKPNIGITTINAEGKQLQDLLLSADKSDFFELLHRISILILSFLLSLFSILVSRTNPRGNNNFSVAYGIIIFFSYYNLNIYSLNSADENRLIESIFNFLYPHLLMFTVISLIFFSRNRLLNPKKIL